MPSLALALDSTNAFTFSNTPSDFNHITKRARWYCSGKPADLNMIPRNARRTLSPAPAPSVPDAACRPPLDTD